VLGGLLLDNSAWDRAADLLTDSDFYRHEHQLIFMAIQQLVSASKPADVITVFEQLQMLGKASEVGGLTYLNALAQSVPSAANMRRYAEIVRERAVLRKLVTASDEIATNAFSPQGKTVSDILDEAEAKIMKIGEEGSRNKQGFIAMDGLVVDLLDRVQELADNGSEDVTGVRTGFIHLDKMTAGLQKADLIILAARPSMGKTALATNIGFNAARAYKEEIVDGVPKVTDGAVVGFFSLEMSAEQLATRMLSEQAQIPSEKIRKGELISSDFDKVLSVSQQLEHLNFFIDDTPALSIAALRTRARRLKRTHGLGLIIVDYLQLLAPSGKTRQENRVQEVSEITRGLKTLAKELDVPVLALSQLSRAVEQREDKRPQLSDLRESGSIEQDADVVMFVFREEYYLQNKEPRPGTEEHLKWQTEMELVTGKAELIIGKQRHGPTGTVQVQFDSHVTRFGDLAHDQYLPERMGD